MVLDRNFYQDSKRLILAESSPTSWNCERLLSGNRLVMEGEYLNFEICRQCWAVISPKQSLKIQRATAA